MASTPQNYKNHIRFYPPHHFVFYPVMIVLITASAWFAFDESVHTLLWVFICFGFVMITWVAFMMRQHYSLTLQNRLILLELRYRYFMVTGGRLEPLEENLSEGQLFSLRFAPDEELEELAARAVNENLTPDAIKKSVRNWKPDNRRV